MLSVDILIQDKTIISQLSIVPILENDIIIGNEMSTKFEAVIHNEINNIKLDVIWIEFVEKKSSDNQMSKNENISINMINKMNIIMKCVVRVKMYDEVKNNCDEKYINNW